MLLDFAEGISITKFRVWKNYVGKEGLKIFLKGTESKKAGLFEKGDKYPLQDLSGDLQRVCGKMHVQILLGVRWCAMSIFLFLKLYNFNEGIIRIYSIFKNPKTNIFKCHLLTL